MKNLWIFFSTCASVFVGIESALASTAKHELLGLTNHTVDKVWGGGALLERILVTWYREKVYGIIGVSLSFMSHSSSFVGRPAPNVS